MHGKRVGMKKIISLLLVAMMCLSLCACGGSETTEIRIEENYEAKDGNTFDYVLYISTNEFKKHLKKVTLTKENWKEYFGDCEFTEHFVVRNAFGEIEEEYDNVYNGFGGEKIVALNNVAFKFSSMKRVNSDGVTEIIYPEGKDYFVVEMPRSFYDWRIEDPWSNGLQPYEDSECIDVIGEIIVWDIDISTLSRPSFCLAKPNGKEIFWTTSIGDSYSWNMFIKYIE